MTLVTGVVLGLAGALLAVRGGRPVPSPRLMVSALALAVVASSPSASSACGKNGSSASACPKALRPNSSTAVMRPYVHVAAALRSLALFGALACCSAPLRLVLSGK